MISKKYSVSSALVRDILVYYFKNNGGVEVDFIHNYNNDNPEETSILNYKSSTITLTTRPCLRKGKLELLEIRVASNFNKEKEKMLLENIEKEAKVKELVRSDNKKIGNTYLVLHWKDENLGIKPLEDMFPEIGKQFLF